MNGTLLDLFGVIAASTGLLGAAFSGALVFLLPRAAVSGALAILLHRAVGSGALTFLLHRVTVSGALAFLLHRATCSDTLAILPSGAACVVCASNLVGRFPKRNNVKECIMSTNKEPKGGETTP